MHPHHILEDLAVATTRLVRKAASSTGTTTSAASWAALSVLHTEGPHRVGTLAAAVRISQPGMTKLLQNLLDDRWVRRIADDADSRAWLITITAASVLGSSRRACPASSAAASATPSRSRSS